MQNKPLPQIVERHLQQKKRVRTVVLKVTAALVLVAFTTMVLHGNWVLALLLIGGGIGAWQCYEYRERRRQQLSLLYDVEAMNDGQFLHYATDLLRAQGYGVLQTRQADARRADLLLMMRGDESVACRLLRRRVTAEDIVKTLTAMRLHGCRRAMVMTSRRVTVAARYVALRSGCVMIDRWDLARLVVQWRQGHRVFAFQREEVNTSARRNG